MDEHIQRRHALQLSQEMMLKNTLQHSQEKDRLEGLLHNVEVEKKIDGLKSYMENFFMSSKNNENLSQIMAHQRSLEEKIKEFSGNANPDLEKQILEVKEILKNSKINNNDNNKAAQEEMEKTLKKIKEDNDQKMINFTNQIEMLRNSFTEELQKIKNQKPKTIIKQQETVSNLKITSEVKKNEEPPKIKTPPKLEAQITSEVKKIEEPPKIKTPPKLEAPINIQTPPKKLIHKKLFNAAELEDDISIEEPKEVKKPNISQEVDPEPLIEPAMSVVIPIVMEEPEGKPINTHATMDEEVKKLVEVIPDPEPKKTPKKKPIKSNKEDDLAVLSKVRRSCKYRDEIFNQASKSQSSTEYKYVKM